MSTQKSIEGLLKRIPCKHCNRGMTTGNLNRHEASCKSNPAYMEMKRKQCPSCLKYHYKNSATCSYACANRHFRSAEENGNWKGENYRIICFNAHGKKCLVCTEQKILTAHHVNEDHSDHRPENLVPLCPTHHQYVHSRYRCEVQPKIDEYLSNYSQ